MRFPWYSAVVIAAKVTKLAKVPGGLNNTARLICTTLCIQERSYRKLIARQLRYVETITYTWIQVDE